MANVTIALLILVLTHPMTIGKTVANVTIALLFLVLTHPMTIGKMVANYTPKKRKDYPKSVHLVGTDTPEVSKHKKKK